MIPIPKSLWGYAGLGAVCLALAVASLVLWSSLDAANERTRGEAIAHNATRAAAARDSALFLLSQRAANATITGLQTQVEALLWSGAASRAASADWGAIFANPATQAAKPSEVVDDSTSRSAVRHINSAFTRAGRVRE